MQTNDDGSPRAIRALASRWRWPSGAGGAAGIAVAMAVALVVTLRQQGRSVIDSMWAEDGAVFVQQAHHDGLAALLLSPYAGYLHVPSRALAALTAIVPIDGAAAVMSGSAAILVALIAVFIWLASGDDIDSSVLRGALGASVVLVPVARIESLSNVSNLHFYLVYAAFWALRWRPQQPIGVALCSVVVAAAALSDPLTVLLAPVVAQRWLRAPDRAGRLPVVIWAIALALHGAVILTSGVETTTGSPTTPDLIAITLLYPLRVVGGAVLGLQRTWDLWEPIGAWLILTGVVILVALIVLVTRWLDDGRRVVATMALGLSAVYFGIALWIRWEPGLVPATEDTFLREAVRYLLLPVLFLYTAMAIGLDGLIKRGGRAAVLATGMIGVLILSAWVVDFRGPNARSSSPSWQASVAEARLGCGAGSTAEVTIPIAPATWTMRLSCDVLAPAQP